MDKYEAIARKDTISIYEGEVSDVAPPIFEIDVGLLLLGGAEGASDALSEQGWEQLSAWKVDRDGYSIYCDVQPVVKEYDENDRRVDLALALVEEDERAGESRPIRGRVDSAIEFERNMRDRKEFP